jgi:hypothetical protein
LSNGSVGASVPTVSEFRYRERVADMCKVVIREDEAMINYSISSGCFTRSSTRRGTTLGGCLSPLSVGSLNSVLPVTSCTLPIKLFRTGQIKM